MSDAFGGRPFPRLALFGAAVLIALTLLVAFVARQEGTDMMPPTGKPLALRDLRFVDQPDGAILVYGIEAGHDPALIRALPPVSNGFLRQTLRGLARIRLQKGATADAPFRLTAWSDGRLTLEDPVTGSRIDLEAFGPASEAVFIQLLPIAGTGS